MSDGADSGAVAAGSEQSGPDYAEQFQVMNDKIDSLSERFPEQEPEPEGDFADRFYQQEPEPGYDEYGISDAEIDEILADGQSFDAQGDLDVAAFDDLVNERVQAQFNEVIGPWQEQQRANELNALAEKYPDILSDEVFNPMKAFLDDLEQRHQNPNLATDPAMVEMAYKAAKAELASAGEVSAETAATGEATLETGAGPSQQGEADPADEYMRGVESGVSGSGAFG